MVQSFQLENILGLKVVWRLLRTFLSQVVLGYSLGELAEELGTSRSSLCRILSILQKEGLILSRKIGGRKIYRVNTEKKLIHLVWSALMLERLENIPARLRGAIELLFQEVKDKVSVFIVFGSVARRMYTHRSDIDICIIGTGVKEKRFDYLPYRFEVHNYQAEDFKQLSDFVILDALMNGIVVNGEEFVYNILKDLKSFPKGYLLYRLNAVKNFIEKAKKLSGESKKYYKNLARITLGEIESLLKKRMIIGKAEIKGITSLEEVEKRLAKEGERIWLM